MLLGINSFNYKSLQKRKFYINVYKSSVTVLVGLALRWQVESQAIIPKSVLTFFFFFIKNALSGTTVVTGNKSGTGNKNLELTLTFFDVVCR